MKASTDLHLTPEEARVLWRMCMFCAEWQGKVIEYTSHRLPTEELRTEKGLVLGHDGPVWYDDLGWRASPIRTFFGWGCVVIMHTPGHRHYTDPANIVSVREIVRPTAAHSLYEQEAGDLYCPYDCDADGLRDWSMEWGGPEYEVFCPVHNRLAHARGEELYHRPESFDGSDPEIERDYFELTKVAYEKERCAA